MPQKSTILIVDDEPSGRDTLEALLFAEGYNLAFASSGSEALSQAADLTPDLILLDVMMPDMNGLEVCKRLRADPLLAEVPIIMVTALDDRSSRLRGIAAGADDFVSKPVDRVELRTRVRTTVRLNRYRALLLERARFEWVVEHADDGYLTITDSDQVLYANPQARAYLGLHVDVGEPITSTFLELATRQYRCEPKETWASWPDPPPSALVQAASQPQVIRYLVRPASETADMALLQVDQLEMTKATWREERRLTPSWRLVRLRDVTNSVAEQRLVWTFHSQVSHKLRSPLSLLTASLEFLDILLADRDPGPQGESAPHKDASGTPVRDQPTGLTALQESLLTKVQQSSARLQEELNRILHYVEASDAVSLGRRSPAVVRKFCLGELTRILAEISSELDLRAIELLHPGIERLDGVDVQISRWAMETVLWELAVNAKKFHPQGRPRLEIIVSRVSDGIRIQVADDGLLLSPDQLSKMWFPYYQAERHFTGQVPGMGLGLSTVATLIWGVDGTCRAYSRETGTGLVVELVLREPTGSPGWRGLDG